MSKPCRILICPLNWGLGHATRIIPLVHKLQNEGHIIIFATDGQPSHILKEHFPEIEQIISESYNVTYSPHNSQIWKMLCCIPRILWRIAYEHFWLKKIIKQKNIDWVISDNRFGLWNKNIHCTYITHQLMVKMPPAFTFIEQIVWRLHQFFIRRYTECWVPDDPTLQLSGDLAHKYPLPQNARFIGPLSRFAHKPIDITFADHYDIVVILSGIEPQRTILENILLESLSQTKKRILLVSGTPSSNVTNQGYPNITLLPHLPDEEMAYWITAADTLICRSGYSSLMDIFALGRIKNTILIPTPGQTEQEYLAKIWNGKHNFQSIKQNHIHHFLHKYFT